MNRGALTWVEIFWSYNAKVIDYSTMFLVNMIKIKNKIFIRIQRHTWKAWKLVVKLNLIKFTS
jgi:hypothetical protein